MKQVICGLLAGVMLLAGTACQQKPEPETAFPAEITTQTLLDSGAFSEQLEALDLDIAVMLFGFDAWCDDPALFEGSAVYYSTGATSEIVAVISVAGGYGGDLAAVTNSLETWVNYQIEAETNYRPAEVPKLENAIIETRGSSVLLVVAADWQKATEAIETIVM